MQKGQGALEYLLLIGGAILVAVIVISIIVGLGGSAGSEAEVSIANAQCAKFPDSECENHQVESGGNTYNCYVFGANACRAQIGIALSAPGPPPITGWQDGGVYFVASNIDCPGTCFNITADNVILNCQGKTLTNTTNNSSVLIVTNDNITVSDCIISKNNNSNYGIEVIGNNNTIKNNKTHATLGAARVIQIQNPASNTTLLNNDLCGNASDTIYGIYSSSTYTQNSSSAGNKCDPGKCSENIALTPICSGIAEDECDLPCT